MPSLECRFSRKPNVETKSFSPFQTNLFCNEDGIGCCSSSVLSMIEVVVLLLEIGVYSISAEIMGSSSAA